MAVTSLYWRGSPVGLIVASLMCGGDGEWRASMNNKLSAATQDQRLDAAPNYGLVYCFDGCCTQPSCRDTHISVANLPGPSLPTGLADIVGRRFGKGNPLPWNPEKSWAGSTAMFLGAHLSLLLTAYCMLACQQTLHDRIASQATLLVAWPLLRPAHRPSYTNPPLFCPAGGLGMSLGLITLFSSLGYFECDMPGMALTGETLLSSAACSCNLREHCNSLDAKCIQPAPAHHVLFLRSCDAPPR